MHTLVLHDPFEDPPGVERVLPGPFARLGSVNVCEWPDRPSSPEPSREMLDRTSGRPTGDGRFIGIDDDFHIETGSSYCILHSRFNQ